MTVTEINSLFIRLGHNLRVSLVLEHFLATSCCGAGSESILRNLIDGIETLGVRNNCK